MGDGFQTSTEELKKRLQLLRLEENLLQESLFIKATLQEYTETHYNLLVDLAYEGMAFLEALQEGDRIDSNWTRRRDELVARAQFLLDDAPIITRRQEKEHRTLDDQNEI
jgi:hypothetical protein